MFCLRKVKLSTVLHREHWKKEIYLLCDTNSMKQSPSWKANQFSASQEIPTLYGTRIIIAMYTSAHHLLILSQINPVHAPSSHCLKIHLKTILHLCLGLFPSGFLTKTLYAPLLSSMHATCPANLILDLITWIIFGESTDH